VDHCQGHRPDEIQSATYYCLTTTTTTGDTNMKSYKVVFKCLFDSTRVEYTVNADSLLEAKFKAIELHEAHELDHIREDYRFHVAIRTA
jgi:hypothetical protein